MPPPIPRRLALTVPLLYFPPAIAEPVVTLDAIMARLAATPERRATFREQRRFAALDSVLESTGHLLYRPGHLEKVTDWPQPERLVVENDRLILTAGNDPPRVIDMARAPELRTLIDAIRGPLAGDAQSVHQAFTDTTSGTIAAWTLDLTPRDPTAAKLLRSVRLTGHEDQIERLTLTQSNGDEQTMTIRPQ